MATDTKTPKTIWLQAIMLAIKKVSGGVPKLSQGAGQNCVRNLRQSNIQLLFLSCAITPAHKPCCDGLTGVAASIPHPVVQATVISCAIKFKNK